MTVRYQLPGLPPAAANGTSAFLPGLTRYAASGAQSYKYGVIGGPANGIPADTTSTAPGQGDLLRLAYLGTAQSSDAPQAWWPNQYQVVVNRQELPGAGMPIQRYNPVRPQDTTMIPVPAVSLRALLQRESALLANPVNPGGQRQIIAKARGLIKWPGRTSTAQGGQGG
jgi:hypothetical protein